MSGKVTVRVPFLLYSRLQKRDGILSKVKQGAYSYDQRPIYRLTMHVIQCALSNNGCAVVPSDSLHFLNIVCRWHWFRTFPTKYS